MFFRASFTVKIPQAAKKVANTVFGWASKASGIDIPKVKDIKKEYYKEFKIDRDFDLSWPLEETVKYETESMEVSVRVPPFSQMSATALAWTATIVLRWRMPKPEVALKDGRTIIADEFDGETRIRAGHHVHVQYRCWTVVDDEDVPCPDY